MKTLLTAAAVCAGSLTLSAPNSADAGCPTPVYRGGHYGVPGYGGHYGAPYRSSRYGAYGHGGYHGYAVPVYGLHTHNVGRDYHHPRYHNSGYRGRRYGDESLSVWGQGGGLNIRW